MKAFWLEEGGDISAAELNKEGVPYEVIPCDDPYMERLEAWRQQRHYAAHDEVRLSPETPQLEAILKQFDAEHLHTDDEVRYIVAGDGIFDIRSLDDRWMRVEVSAGDFIIVPADRYHRFFLTASQVIHAIRLFKTNPSWVPVYR